MDTRKIAVITGAGSGIGRASTLTLARAGYGVVAVGRRIEALQQTALAANAGGADACTAFVADVSQPEEVKALFAWVETKYGRIDVLFNNAGMGAPAVPMEELSYAQWSAVVGTNLTGSFLCAQGAMRLMKKQSPMGGRIINNGSISAHVPRPMSAPYTSTKHAITGLTRSISLDGRTYHIACSQIDIGNAATGMTERMASGILQADGQLRAEARMDVQHVADAVLYIANLPLDVNVQFMTLMATTMPYVGRG